ncbi:hypothetical protein [Qipengyuania sp. JC766]|uniref:hypothetical protein n=1 Tax=Qipengyuania sp. JC766 TaxID=3232139 RepID=UPI0034582AE5
MPHYTLNIYSDENGIGRQIRVHATTPWLAIEEAASRIGAFGAEIYCGKIHLGRVTRQSHGRNCFWEISGPARR